jgi:hypothetical protein
MAGEYQLTLALNEWLRKWRRPDVELDPDGQTRTLRYTLAQRLTIWCMGFLFGGFLALDIALILHDPDLDEIWLMYLGCVLFSVMLLLSVYCILEVYRETVSLDGEGFTRNRFLRTPQRVEWADIQSVRLAADENGLIFHNGRGSVRLPLQMHGLGRFALYLEHFAPIPIPPPVRVMLPRLELAPDEASLSPAE